VDSLGRLSCLGSVEGVLWVSVSLGWVSETGYPRRKIEDAYSTLNLDMKKGEENRWRMALWPSSRPMSQHSQHSHAGHKSG